LGGVGWDAGTAQAAEPVEGALDDLLALVRPDLPPESPLEEVDVLPEDPDPSMDELPAPEEPEEPEESEEPEEPEESEEPAEPALAVAELDAGARLSLR